MFDVLLADLRVNRLLPGEWTEDLAQAIAVRHRTVMLLQFEPQADVQIQIGLFGGSQGRLVLVLAELAQPPLAQYRLLHVDRVALQLHGNVVQGHRRLAIALQMVDLVRDVALLSVLVEQGKRRFHRALGRLLLDDEEVVG